MEPRAFQDDQGGQKENQEPTEHVIDYSITISKRSIKEESDIDILDLSVKRPHKIMKIEVPSPVDIPHERSFEESYVLNSKGIQYISPFSSAQPMFEKPTSLPPMSHSVLSVTSTPPIAPVMPTFRQMPSQPMSHPVLHSAQQIPIIHVPSFEHNRPMNTMSPSHQSCYSHSSSRTSPISPTELPSVFPKSPIISPVSIADSGRKNMRPFKAISIPGDMESDEEYIQYREAIMKSQERIQEKKNGNGRTKNTSSPQPEGPTSNASDGSHVKSDGNSSAATSTSDGKDASYWERRKKNNEAAKRSRDARRAKEDELAIRTSYLERENLYLRHQIQFLQRELAKVNGHIISKVEVLPPPGVMEASEEIKNNVVSYLRPDMVEDTFELCAGINNLRIDSEPADDRSNATFEGTLMDMVVKHRPRKELDSKSFWGLPPSSPPVFQRSPSIMRFLCHITPPRSHSTPHSSFNPLAEQVSPLSQRRSSWYSVVSHSSSTQSPSDTKMLMKSTSCEIIQEVIKAKERENRYSKFKRTLLESLDEMIKESSRSSKSLGNASSTLSYERFHSAYSTPGSPSKTNEMSRADLDLRSFRRASTSTPEEEKELLAKYKRVTRTPKKQSPESSQNDLTPKSSKSDRSVIKTSDLSSHSWKEKDNLFISYESPSYRSPLALGSGIR